MTWIDLLILVVLAISVVMAFVNGLLVELFSLGGVLVGLVIAAADYPWLASWIKEQGVSQPASNLIAFLLIALGVMLLAALVGRLLRGAVRWVGLGFVDRSLGAIFGFIKGWIIVTLFVMAATAFLPDAAWLKGSMLAPVFWKTAHNGSQLVPFDFGERIREGVQMLRNETIG